MRKGKIICVHLFILTIIFLPALSHSKTFHIMLQGFHWNSHSVSGGWYAVVHQNVQRIKDSGFTLIWLPPPSKSVTPQGYEPTQLKDLNSGYGTVAELKNVITVLASAPEVKAIADIVINHRSGSTGWADFTNPDWQTYTIVSDDEWGGAKSMNYDSGEGAPFARDLDHLNPETQEGIKKWMHWLRNTIGFSGWRYDFVKGYAGSAIAMYNDHTSPVFSIGEYFDDNTQKVVHWIDSTHMNWVERSTAFDFPLRKALYQAVAWKNYNYLKYYDRAAGVIGLWSDKAVTFIENHDTEEARNSQYAPPFPGGDQMVQAYAVILTHPGTPCVFWIDIYDSGVNYENRIEELITIRKKYEIHSESRVWIDRAEKNQVYAAYVQGDRGEIAVKIGPASWSPSGEKWDPVSDLLTSGNDYAVWGEQGKFW